MFDIEVESRSVNTVREAFLGASLVRKIGQHNTPPRSDWVNSLILNCTIMNFIHFIGTNPSTRTRTVSTVS